MALPKNPKADLKLKYQKTFEISLVVALLIMIVAFKFFPDMQGQALEQEAFQELVNVEDIVNTEQKTAPPPPPKPPIPIEAPSDEDLEDIEIDDTELEIEEEVAAPPPPPEEEEEVSLDFFMAVEEMPQPIGGIAAIQKKIVYPEIAKRAGVQGRVFVKAFVDEAGKVHKAEIVKGIGAGCDEAAIAAVLKTRFKPGKQRGKPVRVQVSIPILFKLN